MPSPIIDPAIDLSHDERRAVYRAAAVSWLNDVKNSLLFSAGLLGIFFFVFVVVPGRFATAPGREWIGIAAYVLCFPVTLAYVLICRRCSFAPFVYAELAARGIEVCGRCGYPLDALPDDRAQCPECGRDRVS
jgi:hypothetical protein